MTIIETQLGVEICNHDHDFEIIGNPKQIEIACDVIEQLYQDLLGGQTINKQHLQLLIKSSKTEKRQAKSKQVVEKKLKQGAIKLSHKTVTPRTPNQHHFTVATALAAYQSNVVNRIVLTRPAVEAGENLGFLPGDLTQKIDPYLRPLYDALYELAGSEKINNLIGSGTIEIAPLAFMRGRTLNDAFIILDEGQNTTKEQMKMFLTRIGFGSKAVITGDITQVDLPQKSHSGLRHVITILKSIEAIKFTFFDAEDVVRHPLVQQVIEAYENTPTEK